MSAGCWPAAAVAQPVDAASRATVERIRAAPAFRRAEAALADGHDRFVRDIIQLTEIPAPPFGEQRRGEAFRALMVEAGLTDVTVDSVGNVIGLRRGSGPAGRPPVVVSAHLDTVFPEGTDVRVRREGTRLSAPGIGDDSRGLAALLAYVRALDAAGIRTRRDLLIVGTVSEEGRGDLRGVRQLFADRRDGRGIAAFFSVDGLSPARITRGGVGSKRYRVLFRGPGGHSYGAFGLVNPAAAMARAITDLYALPVPQQPRTTFSASVVGGGTSVNAIPSEVFVEVDMRSEDATALARLDEAFRGVVERAVAVENESRSTREGRVTATLEAIGDRPAGETPATSPIVRLSAAASAAAGYAPTLDASSTDANMAMSLGVPAVTIGSGGTGGRAHALDEWIDVAPEESVRGLAVGLLAIVAVADQPDSRPRR
ncbi:M20/M25/M40 family metallo-hydrolase [Sphingomonas jejuensis]|nr:M20/M25/M40 family metallo-hydrolase [Sphingomonas jejuensis]